MSPSSRVLNDTVLIVRPGYATVEPLADDWNQPVAGDPTEVGFIAASVQPRTVEELAAQSQAGPIVSEYVVFMPYGVDVRASDYIVHDTGVYQLTTGPKDQAGRHVVVSVEAEQVIA